MGIEGSIHIKGEAGSTPSDKGQYVSLLNNSTSTFPTTRNDGSALQDRDYCVVSSSSSTTFPFSVSYQKGGRTETVTFEDSQKGFQVQYYRGDWVVESGVIVNTDEVVVENSSTESISGTAGKQNKINQEVVQEFTDLPEKAQTLKNKTMDFDDTATDKNIATNIPLTSFKNQTSANRNKILQVNPSGAISLEDLDIIIDTDIATASKSANADYFYRDNTTGKLYIYRNSSFIKVGGGGVEKVSALPTTNIDDNLIYQLNKTDTSTPTNTYITLNIHDTALNQWYCIYTNEYGEALHTKQVDNSTIEFDTTNNYIKVKDEGITFAKLNTNAVSTAIDNTNNKVARTDAVYKELLNNTNSTFEYVDTNTTKDVINLKLQNNNTTDTIDKTIDFNDKLTFKTNTQTLSNKTLDCDTTSATKNVIQNLPLSSIANQTVAKAGRNIVVLADGSVGVEEDPPAPTEYKVYFGSANGTITEYTSYVRNFTGTITMTNDSIVYKYPAVLGNLVAITGNGVDYLTLFTKTTETITIESEDITYNVYTQSNTVSVSNFSISFA